MRDRYGFTLLELIVVMALLITIVGLGWAFSFTYFRAQQIETAADIVATEISRAQAESFAQTDDTRHGVAVFTDRVVRFQGASYASRNTAADVATTFPAPVTPTGTTEIVFPLGSLAPSSAFTISIEDTTIAVDITVSAYGLVEQTKRTISP